MLDSVLLGGYPIAASRANTTDRMQMQEVERRREVEFSSPPPPS